ncbi:leucine-rich repeats and immunoglobulin-like domains protein 1 [Wyeomyia smithii]|uniref:leucine-rich repeats and immunoglobulin-like domains protein 1 n=1 Tax=Wyeomyia smithii TaxID=174621 RepID=UPI0024680DA9|nr:leucine-rich repeats and immunoglobulin-like domains protein 1 [Wyeomyia smithii]
MSFLWLGFVLLAASEFFPAQAIPSSSLIKLNCETINRVCYLKNIYATEEDRFKDVHGAEFGDAIEFYDCHIYTLPKMPFIKRLNAKGINLVRIGEKAFSTVRHVNVAENRLRDFSPRAFEWPEELETLVLSGNPALKELSVLKKLTSLTDLQMAQMKLDLDFVDPEIFSGMKKLITLNLSDNKILSVPVGIFNKLESLESLNLSQNYISKITSGALVINRLPINEESYERQQLSISLAKNNISIIENNSFMVVDLVDLSDNKLIGISPSALYNKSQLGTLILSKNSQLKNFDFLQNLATLHTLTMSHMNFTFDGIPLNIFSKLDLLTSLDLSHNDIGTIPIGAFAELSSVNYINLRHNQILYVEFGTFSIRKYDLIDEIDLSYNQISDVNYLVFAPLKYLRTLLLHGNQITHVNAGHLKRNKSLQNFGIQNNPILCSDLVDLLAILKLVLDGNEFVAHSPNVNGIRCNP